MRGRVVIILGARVFREFVLPVVVVALLVALVLWTAPGVAGAATTSTLVVVDHYGPWEVTTTTLSGDPVSSRTVYLVGGGRTVQRGIHYSTGTLISQWWYRRP